MGLPLLMQLFNDTEGSLAEVVRTDKYDGTSSPLGSVSSPYMHTLPYY